MTPNLETHNPKFNQSLEDDIPLLLTPIIENEVLFEENNQFEDHSLYQFIPDITIPMDISYIPLEQNLRELLVRKFQIVLF